MKMAFGNMIGFKYADSVSLEEIFAYNYGSFIIELSDDTDCGTVLGYTTDDGKLTMGDAELLLSDLCKVYEDKLEPVYSCNIEQSQAKLEAFSFEATERKAPAI